MTADEFEDRVAALEEHIVPTTAEEYLKRAEAFLAEGSMAFARLALMHARIARERDRFDEFEEDEDA